MIGNKIANAVANSYDVKITKNSKDLQEKRVIEKPVETTGDLIGNKIAHAVPKSNDSKITKVSQMYYEML